MDQTQPKTPNYSESRRNDFGRSYDWGFGQSRKDDKYDHDWLNDDKSKRNFSDLDSEEIGKSRGIAQSLGQTRRDNLDLGFNIYESRKADKYYDGSIKEDYESTKGDQSLRPYGTDYWRKSQLAKESTNSKTFLSQTENDGREFSKSKRGESSGAYLGKTFHDTRTRESSIERQHGYTQDWGKSRQENGVSNYKSDEIVSTRGIGQSSKQNVEHRNYGESRADDRSNGPLTLQNKFDNELGQSRFQDGESDWERRSLQSLPERKDWRHIASSGTFRRDYFDVKDSYRPRISIRANIKDYGNSFKDDSLNTSSASFVRRWPCSRYVMIVCIILACAAIAGAITLAVVLSTLSKDPPKDTTKYFEVSMNSTVQEEFIEEYSNISSAEFRNFSNNFCNAVKEYSNNVTYSDGSQCIVDVIRNGSCIVSFRLIYIFSATISTTVVTNDLQSIFNTSSSSLNVGVFVFIQVTVIQVEVRESVVTNPVPQTQTTQAVTTQSTTPIATTETTTQSTSPIATTSTTTELTTFETTITENDTEEMNTTNLTTETDTITMYTAATFSSESDKNTTSTMNSSISNTTPSSTDTETSTASTVPTTISSTTPSSTDTETSTASTVPTTISSTTPTNKETETSTASTVPTTISSTTPTNKETETSTASTVPTTIPSTTPTNKETETSTASPVPTTISSTTPTNKETETSTASTVPTTISSSTPTNRGTETSTASTVPTTISSTTPTNKETETSTASTVPTTISSSTPTNKDTETSTVSTVPTTISSTTPTNKETETSTSSTVPTTISSTTPTNKETDTSTVTTIPTTTSHTTPTNKETETSTSSTVQITISSPSISSTKTDTSTASTMPTTIPSKSPTNQETESTATTVPSTIPSSTSSRTETDTNTASTMPTTISSTALTNKETHTSTALTVTTTIPSSTPRSTETETSIASKMPTTISSTAPTNKETDRSTESTMPTTISSSTPSSSETDTSTASTMPTTISSTTTSSTETDTRMVSTMPTIMSSKTPTAVDTDASTLSTMPTTMSSTTPSSADTDAITASTVPTTVSSTTPSGTDTDASTASTVVTTILSTTMTIDTDVHFVSTNVANGNQKAPSVETGGILALTCNSASSQSLTVKRFNGNGEEVIAVFDGNTVQISNNYTSRIVESSGNRSMDLNISNISCRDEGLYVCESMIEDGTRVNASLTVQVYGKADLAVNADFVELFPRLNYDHVCSVTIVETGNAYVRIEDSTGALTSTTYDYKSNNGTYDTTKNFTRVSLPNGDEMFVISETEQSNGCETSQKIYFLLNITNTWNGGSVSCGYEDVRQGRHINDTKPIQLIPRYYCDGFSNNFYRQHPEGCTKYVQCSLIDGDMYPFGFSCNHQCFNFQTELCATCEDEATCQEHTTPRPTTPVPTIDPSQVVISCNDSTVNLENSPVVLKPCSILKNNFTSINISKENSLGEIFNIGLLDKDGQTVIQSSDDFRGTITLSDTIEFVFTNVTCADEAVYNMYVLNYGQHVWTTSFSIDVEVGITYGNLSIKSSYDEGEDLTITGVFYVNSAQDIEVSIKYPSLSEFTELQGNLISAKEECLLKVTWTAQDALRLSASMSGAVVKVFDTRTMRILDQQAVMVTLQSVGFDEYTRTVPLGEDATIRCVVRDISDWTVIEIIKEYNNTNTTVLSQKKDYDIITMSDRISGTLTTNGTSLYIDVVIRNVMCSDEANYACVVNTSSSAVMTSSNNFVLSVTDLPGTPTLNIHANFVARIAFQGYLHKCSCTLGYPAGTIHLGIRLSSVNGSQFVYSEPGVDNTIVSGYLKEIDIDTTLDEKMLVKNNIVVENGCHIEQTIEFLLQLHDRWNFGNITCFIEESDDKVNETSTTKEIVLTPRDVCHNISDNEKIQHPDGCNKWIICASENPFGQACTDETQCYDVYNNRDYCEPCNQVYCGPLTTTTPAATTTVNQDDIRVQCNRSTVENGAADVRTLCILNVDSFFSINISKANEGNPRQTIISFDENSVQYYGMDTYSVETSFTGTPKSFSLVIPLANCSYQGTYTVEVFLYSNETSVIPVQFDINILDKPDEPVLNINEHASENSASPIHTCTGYLGNPRGTFKIEVKKNDTSNFQEYPQFLSSGEEKVTKMRCGEHVEYTFGLKMQSSFNLSTVRCQAENEFSVSSGDEILSNSEVITLIPDGYCSGNTSEYKHHPLGCGYYIRCVNGLSFGTTLNGNLCYNFATSMIDFCRNVDECD